MCIEKGGWEGGGCGTACRPGLLGRKRPFAHRLPRLLLPFEQGTKVVSLNGGFAARVVAVVR